MPRHIIIEGMDGSGKDTLIADLIGLFPDHTLHPRASTSLGGPVPNVAVWTANDVKTMATQAPSIYNRHPIISEPIYASIRKVNPGLKPPWDSASWIGAWTRNMAHHAVLVICQPSYITVRGNLIRSGPAAHMPGVFENSWKLYQAYALVQWPLPIIWYDYDRMEVPIVAAKIRRALARNV